MGKEGHDQHREGQRAHEASHHGGQTARESSDHGGHSLLGGLSIAADGYRLVPAKIHFEPGVEQTLAYEIRDFGGRVVTEFEETHGKLSHLILVRRDLTHFQHLHPELGPDGTWSREVTLSSPGVYRAFVDVRIDGRSTTLGTDLFVPGSVEVASRPSSTRVAEVDGYEVTLTPEAIRFGEDVTLEFTIRLADSQPTELDEYLEALGHLVALREGDLGYLHVHPEESEPESGTVRFRARFPTAGRYRLFLQAKPDGNLVTTSFDLQLEDVSAA